MASNPYVKAVAGSNSSKRQEKPQKSKVSKAKAVAAPGTNNAAAQDDVLRAEILALGGDEEDLKMLQDVESESEFEEDASDQVEVGKGGKGKAADKVDPALSEDLRSLLKSLDFAAAGGAALADDDDEEETEDLVEDQEDEGVVTDEDEESVTAPKAEVASSKPSEPEKKKESKYEREERRKVERELEKAEAKLEKAIARESKLEASAPAVKSPWVVDPTPQWYAVPVPAASAAPRPSPGLLSKLTARGETVLAKDNELYASTLTPGKRGSAPPPATGLSKADQVFIQQILTSGTSSDKVSALLLLCSSSPLHTMAYLDQLASLAKKKSRDESGRAVRGVVEWWRGDGGDGGGAPGRKLRYFADQPGLGAVAAAFEALEGSGKGKPKRVMSQQEVDRVLAVYAFEDWLKKWYFQILQALESMSVDPLPHPRTLAVLHLSNLLRDKPEQESNILRLLVNKLGDSNRNIASKTSHHLLQVLQFHPGMTPIVVREVSSLILRPTVPATSANTGSHVRFGDDKKDKVVVKPARDRGQDHARYYGVITLNQIMLKKEQSDVAGKMIEVYFEIFGDILGRLPDGDDESKDKVDDKEEGEQSKSSKGEKRKRGSNEKVGKKGSQASENAGEIHEQDSKLIAAVLTGVNRAFPFAKIDDEAFKKRTDVLFRITHTGTFNVSIQALMLIYHVSASKKTISDRFYRALYASLFDPRLAGSSKQALYLNLVFKAVKQDKEKNRVMAFVKRLVQLLLNMDVTFILGSLWIIGELLATISGLRKMVTEGQDVSVEAAATSEGDVEGETKPAASGAYDGKKREPLFANAQRSCLWEVIPLLHHWHPTVALHAQLILDGEPISASADLEQHSLNHFLDRFVYRESKKSAPTKGSSMMQSGVPGQDRSGRVVMAKSASRGDATTVNSDLFRKRNEADIPVDQLFFHKYFRGKETVGDDKAKASGKRKYRNKDGAESDSEEESIGDLGFSDREDDLVGIEEAMGSDGEASEDEDPLEDEIWAAMRKSMPKAKGGHGDDEDDDVEDGDEDDDVAEFHYSDSDEDGQAVVEARDEDEDEDEDDGDEPFRSAFPDEDDFSDDEDGGFIEDEDDLIGSDEDMPMFDDLAGEDSDQDEEESAARASKRSKKDERKNKKRKLKHMPMFATAEDYAHLLGNSDDEDI